MALVKTDLATVLKAMRDKLITDGIFNASTCWLTLNPDKVCFPPSDQFAVIVPGRQAVNRRVHDGAGRTVFLMDGEASCVLWSRCALDQTPRDDSFLADATVGALATWLAILGSLELYQPTDGVGNLILHEGFKYRTTDRYSRDFEGVGWGQLWMTYEFEWSANIATTASSGGG